MGKFRQLSPEFWPLLDIKNSFLVDWEISCFAKG